MINYSPIVRIDREVYDEILKVQRELRCSFAVASRVWQKRKYNKWEPY